MIEESMKETYSIVQEYSYQNSKLKYQSIQLKERSKVLKKMLQIKRNPDFSFDVHRREYPFSGTFKYEENQLCYFGFEQSKWPSAILINLHGMNCHSGWSGYFSSVLAQVNEHMNVYAFDQLNFGQSPGPFRGLISSLDGAVQQLQAFVQFLLGKIPSKPRIYLSGHSLGGAIAFKACLKKPESYSGLILLSPALRNLAEDSPYLKKIGKMLGRILPRVRLQRQTYGSGTRYTKDEEFYSDPFIYNDGIVPGTVRMALETMDEVSQLFKGLQTPYLLFQGGVDKFVDPFAALDLEAQSSAKDKTTIYYEDMWHFVFTQPQISGISKLAAEWLKKRQ